MKITLIGPFSPPIHGNSLANDVLFEGLIKLYCVQKINTSQNYISSDQGSSFSWYKFISFIKIYKNLYKLKGMDIIYITTGHTFYGVLKYAPFIIFSWFLRIPYVIHLHGNFLGQEYKRISYTKKIILKNILKKASAGIVLSDSLKSNFCNLIDLKKIFVVENFASDELVNLKLGAKSSNILNLLFLSNIMTEKGIFDIIEALEILDSKNINYKFNIAGRIENGIKESFYNKLAILKGTVKYHGIVKGLEKVNLLSQSNVFILPTYYKIEGQPISILEAMATANILVVTKHSGIPDIISEDNGFFVNKNDPEDIALKLIEIQNNLKDYLEGFSEFNVSYVKQNFTESIFVNKISNILLNIVKSNG